MTHAADLHADVAEILLTEEEIAAKVRELGARISADYAGRRLTLVSVLKGSLPFMADLMRSIDIPVRIDLMEVSSYGGASDRIVGAGPDPQGPVGEHRRRGRPDRRGHHRYRADAQLPDPLPARQGPRVAPDLHPARQARPPAGRDQGRLRRVHDPRPVRGRLRARLRGAVPEPALRGRAPSGGLLGGARGMTMHRRPLGRGRTLAILAGILIVLGCVLQWWQVGGTPGIPQHSRERIARQRDRGLPRRDRGPGARCPAVRGR